jgi:hypothetical protein
MKTNCFAKPLLVGIVGAVIGFGAHMYMNWGVPKPEHLKANTDEQGTWAYSARDC